MVYLINGEKSLIDKEVNDLIKKYNTTSIIKYDLVFNKISDVINDINTVNLFSDKKVIICSSINNIDNIDILVKYLDNQNDNILILTNEDKIDLKILNKIKNKNIEKIDLSNIDLTSFIKEEFKDYKISFKEINMLKDYTSNDYNRIKEEIIKLKMYKIENNEDELKIIGFLSNNYTLIYKIQELIKEYSDEECMLKLNKMHPYRFKLLKEQALSLDKKYLLTKIKELAELDIKIKSGVINPKLGMELFFCEL